MRICFYILIGLILVGCSNKIGQVSFTDKHGNILNYHENSGLICIYRPNSEQYRLVFAEVNGKNTRSIIVNENKLTPKSDEVFLMLGNGKYFHLDDFNMGAKEIDEIVDLALEETSKPRNQRSEHFTKSLENIFGNKIVTNVNELIEEHY